MLSANLTLSIFWLFNSYNYNGCKNIVITSIIFFYHATKFSGHSEHYSFFNNDKNFQPPNSFLFLSDVM